MESIAKAIWQAVWKSWTKLFGLQNVEHIVRPQDYNLQFAGSANFDFQNPVEHFPRPLAKHFKKKIIHTHTHFWRFERYFMYPRLLLYMLARISTDLASISCWSRYERVLDDVEEVPLGPWRVYQFVRCEDFVQQQNGENQLLVTDEPVEGEKWSVEDFSQVTHHFRGIYGTRLKLIEKKRKIRTCNRQLNLEHLRDQPSIYAQKSPVALCVELHRPSACVHKRSKQAHCLTPTDEQVREGLALGWCGLGRACHGLQEVVMGRAVMRVCQ